MKWKDACSVEWSYDKPRQHIQKQKYHFADSGPYSQTMVFPVVTYGCESWTMKKAETLESALDSKEIKPVNAKGNQL